MGSNPHKTWTKEELSQLTALWKRKSSQTSCYDFDLRNSLKFGRSVSSLQLFRHKNGLVKWKKHKPSEKKPKIYYCLCRFLGTCEYRIYKTTIPYLVVEDSVVIDDGFCYLAGAFLIYIDWRALSNIHCCELDDKSENWVVSRIDKATKDAMSEKS